MAILTDIETPQNCKECPFSDIVVVGHIYREQYICNFNGKHQSLRMQKRPDWCPLREINTDGDIIRRADAMDAVQDHFNADGFRGYDDGQTMMDRIKALPSAEGRTEMSGYVKKNDVMDILHEVEQLKQHDRDTLPYDAFVPDGYYHSLTLGRIMALPETQINEEMK